MAPIAAYGHSKTNENQENTEVNADIPTIDNIFSTITPCPLRAPLVVTIAGLPGRGKSFAAHKIARHLCWRGEMAKVFTVDNNATTETLSQVVRWFHEGNNVFIIDGMHLTRKSREIVANFCAERIYHNLIVEFDCNEISLEANLNEMIRFYRKVDSNVDWKNVFLEELNKCSTKYEKCSAIESPLIVVNNSEDPLQHCVTARGVQGALPTAILGVLSHPVIKEQIFYFSRHGESEFNVLGRIGGDADLSPRGRNYAERLKRLFNDNQTTLPAPQLIWTSELQRTINTVKNIPGHRAAINDLNEINAGICEGLTYEEIQERFPQEFVWRDQDKLKYRYPHGESYLDLLLRVDSVVQALLTKTRLLVISHQAVLRCIMAYFMGTKPDQVPYINVPLHTLLVVRTSGYNFEVEEVPLNVDCVDTYRIKPKDCTSERTSADALGTVPAHFDMPLPQTI